MPPKKARKVKKEITTEIFYQPEPFVYTQKQNARDIKLLNMIKKASTSFSSVNLFGKPEILNPENDADTKHAVFNAPINYNDSITKQIIREPKRK